MEHLRKFLRLPNSERRLLIEAALLLEAIKLGMRLLPFRTLRGILARVANVPARLLRPADFIPSDRVAWAVEAASRHTPRVKSCLAQALATQVLLTRRGYPSLLHIGVTKGERGQLRAHAWVESEGRILIGGSGLERFTPLAVLEKGLEGFSEPEVLSRL
jgi:Transglutaminase-like superfamily